MNYISLLICTHADTHKHSHFIRLKLTAKTQTIAESNGTERGTGRHRDTQGRKVLKVQ